MEHPMARKAVPHSSLISLICLLLSTPAAADYKINYIHTDHRGAPVAITDQSETIIWRASYKPFGEAILQEDPDGAGVNTVMNIRYPGQFYDQETGTYYNYYRDYDPGLGRYIQSDPIGVSKDFSDPQLQVVIRMGIPLQGGELGLNHLYGFAEQNPLFYIDPYGLDIGQMKRHEKNRFIDGADSTECRLICAFDPRTSVASEAAGKGLTTLGSLGKAYASRVNFIAQTFGAASALSCMKACREKEANICLKSKADF
jgi:RHS repeat-associated protein